MLFKMQKADKTIEFLLLKKGDALKVDNKRIEYIPDFADVYIRLREAGFEDVK